MLRSMWTATVAFAVLFFSVGKSEAQMIVRQSYYGGPVYSSYNPSPYSSYYQPYSAYQPYSQPYVAYQSTGVYQPYATYRPSSYYPAYPTYSYRQSYYPSTGFYYSSPGYGVYIR